MARSSRSEREERERLRRFQARNQLHEHGVRVRRRDNLVAIIGGLAIIVAATAGQLLYFSVGPGGMPAASEPTGADDDASADDLPGSSEPESGTPEVDSPGLGESEDDASAEIDPSDD